MDLPDERDSTGHVKGFDYLCETCKPPRIFHGPHTGEHPQPSDLDKRGYYKGAPVSHAPCPDCQRKHRAQTLRHRGRKFLRLHHVEGVQ